MPKLPPVINFERWIEENRHLLKPPVGNKAIYHEDYIVMIIGGPNSRKDYHLNATPEFYYQVEGDIVLKVIEEGRRRDVHIRQGDMFYLPGGVPHSPQRGPDTIGMVIEMKRPEGAEDGLAWYCENCNNKLHEETFPLDNIEKDLEAAFDRFYSSPKLRTCSACGTVMPLPKPVE